MSELGATLTAYALNLRTVLVGERYLWQAWPHGQHWFEQANTPEEAAHLAKERILCQRKGGAR